MIEQQDLVTLAAARSQLRINHRTLRRLLSDAGVPLYSSPTDKRVILVNRGDVTEIAKPRRLTRPTEGGTPSPNAA